MLKLTLDTAAVTVNPSAIETIELEEVLHSMPWTIITLVSGRELRVKESPETIEALMNGGL